MRRLLRPGTLAAAMMVVAVLAAAASCSSITGLRRGEGTAVTMRGEHVNIPRSTGLAAALGLLAWAGLGVVPAASAATASCTVINTETHASYTSLQAAVIAASPGATLQVSGTCTGITTIPQNLTVTGVGRSATLSGGGLGTVLTIDAGATVTINALTLTDGYNLAGSGGIDNNGTLKLSNATVTGNTGVEGGGIYNGGTMTLDSASVTDNTVADDGGGVWNGGTMTLDSATVTDNTAPDDAGGGIYSSVGTVTTLNDLTTVSYNTAGSGGGGGIYNNGTVTLNDLTTVSHNASSDGGGIFNEYKVTLTGLASVSHNAASSDGGGIFNGYGTVTLTGAAFVIANTADTYGGGIYNYPGATVTLKELATVSFNTAGTDGGGIYNDGGTLNGAVAGRNVIANKPDNIVNA